jgi:conjugative relaxase-like TrwC/TraI family protein
MVASVARCYTNPKDYAQENYYTEGEGFSNAEWLGRSAKIQGLSGQIKEQDFLNAYSSLDPNGNPLRKQQQYKKSSYRYNRPGTDVTLSAPKSVSIAALVYQDQDILKAHQDAVRATMKYVENNCIFYQTKQRGQKLLLPSKTAQIAVFHHDDNRNKDPQLHSHCVILNQTQCPDQKWRAVANRELYKQQKTIGAYYDHELSRQLQQLGYQVEWTSNHTLELAGVDKEKLDAVFSTRSNQIEAELAKLGLTRSTASAEQKQAVCLKTRKEKKQHHHPQDRIKQQQQWQQKARDSGIELNRPTEYHRDLFERTYNPFSENSLNGLISNATSILTERSAAFLPHELLRECLRQSQGRYDPEKIQTEIAQYKEFVLTRDGRLTTTEALSREQKIVQLASSGRDSQISLSSQEQAEAVSKSLALNQGQTNALKLMATSRDTVILIQGNAGVGKTYTMKAFVETVGDKQPLRGLAPSAAAAGVLQNESGITSQTLASYLLTDNQQLPQQEVILVDEAGMISTRSAQQLLEKAQATKSRVILIGDTKQLSAIETGAPFKLLQEAGFPTAIIDQNLRQRDPFLKQVVNSLATHDLDPDSVNRAYLHLNESGKIKQMKEDESRIRAISSDYLSRPVEVRQKTLILTSTNRDKQAIASEIRQGLICEGTLRDKNLPIQTLRRKNIDKFALTQAHHYQRGDVIKFQTDSARFSKDLYYRVTSVNSETKTATLIDTVGITETLELNKYKQREIYQLQQSEIRPGERMRFTKNIRTADYQQLNGQRFTVEGITPEGQITINSNGKTQDISIERLLHSDYSYVDTVHSSQGQTADYCIYSATNGKSFTIGRESFYVAASRARQEFVVYTGNAQDLGVTVQISRANENALDLVNSTVARDEVVNDAKFKLQTSQTPPSQQDKPSNPSLALTEQEFSNSSNERDERSVRNESESSERGIGFNQVIDSLTDSSRRATNLAENLRGTNREVATAGTDKSDFNRATEKPGNRVTETNREAEELTREFQKLEQRARSSSLKNREARNPAGTNLDRYPGQFVAKIKQFARDIFTDSENIETGQVRSSQPTGRSNDYQTSRAAQRSLDYSTDHQSGDLGTQPHQSPKQKNTSRDQGQSQQQRNPSQPNRGSTRQLEPRHSPASSTASLSQPLSKDEVNQILLTAASAINRYSSERDKKKIFNSPYYQIKKFSVFETYGYQSYFTIDAKDGRGRILTLSGQNFHPANLKVKENHLTKQDVLTFEKIQSVLDYFQQIRQIKENAETILLNYGKQVPQQSLSGTFEGKNYRIERDEQALRIIAKDGRGEILNYSTAPHTRYPENKAISNFNQEDVKFFDSLAQQIEQKQQEEERNRQRELSQEQQQGWGLSL